MIGDGEGIAVASIAELEFALEVGAPEVVGRDPLRQRRAGGAPTGIQRFDETMPAKDRMDRALGGDAKIAVQLTDEYFPDLAGAPVGLVLLAADDQAFDLPGSWLA